MPTPPLRHRVGLLLVALALTAAGGCSTGEAAPDAGTPRDPAAWALVEGQEPTPESTSIPIMAWRVSCAGGDTGTLQDPIVEYLDDAVVVTIQAEKLPKGFYTCQSNNRVPLTIELNEPLGQRDLIDSECDFAEPGQPPACQNTVRWSPAG